MEKRKATRGAALRMTPTEQLFLHVATAEERVPPPTATPTPPEATPPEATLGVGGHLGSMSVRPARPTPAKRRQVGSTVGSSDQLMIHQGVLLLVLLYLCVSCCCCRACMCVWCYVIDIVRNARVSNYVCYTIPHRFFFSFSSPTSPSSLPPLTLSLPHN